jgi:methyl-accepting chemotaxis protein
LIYLIFITILLSLVIAYLIWDRSKIQMAMNYQTKELEIAHRDIERLKGEQTEIQNKVISSLESIREVFPHYINIKKDLIFSQMHVTSVATNLQNGNNELVSHFTGILSNIEAMIQDVLKVTDKAEAELLSFVSDNQQDKKFRIQSGKEGELGNQEFIEFIQKKYNDLLQRIIDELVITHQRKEEDIKSLDEIYQRVHGIIKFSEEITDIAGGIELISLNANIEAAHAGDAGKGFTVVANEIRRMANMSEEAASRIKKEIKETNEFIKVSISSIKDAMDAESKYLNSTIAIIQDVFFAMTKTLFQLIFELTITLMNSMGSSSKIKEEVDSAITAMQFEKYIFELSETTRLAMQKIIDEIERISQDSLKNMSKLEDMDPEILASFQSALKTAQASAKDTFDYEAKKIESDDVTFF